MIIDFDLTVWDNTTLATSGTGVVSANTVDIGAILPDAGRGYPVKFYVRQDGDVGVGAGTYRFDIITSASDALTSPNIIMTSGEIVATTTGIFWQGAVSYGLDQLDARYLGMRYTVTGAVTTAPTVGAGFAQGADSYLTHAAGVTSI